MQTKLAVPEGNSSINPEQTCTFYVTMGTYSRQATGLDARASRVR